MIRKCGKTEPAKESAMAEGRVEDIYRQLKSMAVSFQIRPGDRLNEVALSRDLGVSRTPLREALNRLVAEGLVQFRLGEGFFCRALDPQTVFDLFELRQIIEAATARLACERADDKTLVDIRDQLLASGIQTIGLTVAQAVARDEAFHMSIARAAGNVAMAAQLERINESIRYIRWISLSNERLKSSKSEHIAIADALVARNAGQAADIMTAHIARRMDQVTAVVAQGISTIFMDQAAQVSDRVLVEDKA
jgi:DNA-binding GntR family transcriptional regulator